MAPSRALSTLLAASLEALAIGAAADDAAALAVALHAAACVAATFGLRPRLAPRGGAWELALLGGAAFFMPLLGLLGCAALAWALPATPLPRRSGPWTITPVPPPSRKPGAGGAGQALGRRDREARMRSVLEARAECPATIRLLRRALRDPDEEVRLLAHAMLEKRTRRDWRRIEALTRQLPEAGPRRGALELRIGSAQWELVRQGLVEGESREHVLEGALAHLRAALASEGHRASLHYLLGRVHLARGETREAEAALRAALSAGLSSKAAAPWLAEIAFVERRLPDLAAACAPGPAVPRLQEFWA